MLDDKTAILRDIQKGTGVADKMEHDYDAGTVRCRICAKEFFTREEVEKHYKETHSEEITSVGE